MKWPWSAVRKQSGKVAVAPQEHPTAPTPTESVAIISDIHGNLQALEAVLADIKTQGVHSCYCAGDIVGYGGNPAKCLDIIRDLGFPCVRGNHDSYAVGLGPQPNSFGEFYRACEWTRNQISDEGRKWLAELPLIHDAGDFELVHASLHEPDRWEHLQSYDSSHFECQTKNICFVGHTHQPKMWVKEIERPIEGDGIEEIRKDRKQIIDVGSVGQPRDDNPKACYLLFRRSKSDVWWRRVSYDIEGAQRAIIDAGLPSRYAARLEVGH